MPSSSARLRAPCWKASKIRSWSSSGIPTPVSRTGRDRRRHAPTVTPIRPPGELHGIREEIQHDLLHPQLVGANNSDIGCDVQSDPMPCAVARSLIIAAHAR